MIPRRRLLAGAAGAAAGLAVPAFAQVPDWSLRAQQRVRGADSAERQALIAQGEHLLAARDTTGAEAAFDRAALMLHAADTEIALVRTYLQQGRYRRALAFCAHAAGVHRDVVAAAALYVWLLDLGGQPAVARQRLDEAEALYPGEALLATLRAQLHATPPRAAGALRALPARLAPYAPPLGEPARVAGAAVLLPDASAALAPAALLAGTARAWLRNGLGDTVAARVQPLHGASGLALLQPLQALPGVPEAAPAARDPYAGRPGFVVGQAPRDDAQSEWPRLRMGFLGATLSDGGRRRMGIALPGLESGALLLDEAGRLAGVALDRGAWWPVSVLRGLVPLAAQEGPADRLAPDAACERGLRLSLQLLVPA